MTTAPVVASESFPPPPLLFIETVGVDGRLHKQIVQYGDTVPDWFSDGSKVRVAAPNGQRREGVLKDPAGGTGGFYQACRRMVGHNAEWLPSISRKAAIPEHDYRIWIDGHATTVELERLVGKFIKFELPDDVESYFEISNIEGPKLFAPIDRSIYVYIDILKGETGAFLCPRVLTNFTFPAALWAFRRTRMMDAAEAAAAEVVVRCREDEDRTDWIVAAGQSLLLYPDLTAANRSKVLKVLFGASARSPDAAICAALIRIMDAPDDPTAYSDIKCAFTRLIDSPPKYACTMEVLDANIDVLAALFKADDKAGEALVAVRRLLRRIRASFGRGDVNVFRGNSPSEPDYKAIGSGLKKKSSVIREHLERRREPEPHKPAADAVRDLPITKSSVPQPRHRREPGHSERAPREERNAEFVDKLVHINRVTKVVKGGKRFGFAALVVIGDQKGRVGFGTGKAREVPEAIRKAADSAMRNLTRIALREGRTLHHDMAGRHGAGRVYLRSAPAGTGIIAGGPMRAVFETLGIQDVVAKSVGSSNPYNMVRATFDALKHQESPRSVAARRNLKVSKVTERARHFAVE